jgi:uncharacterized NAD(P)/FAD-binding protein YdhS
MADVRRVAIVGGGASGTLTAVQLLRRGAVGLQVTVIEPRPALGRGVAFGTPDPWHRLNVPAVTMTGLPDDVDHFWRWAGVEPASFPPRATYGKYLEALLAEAVAGSPAGFQHRRSRATAIDAEPALRVHLDDGTAVDVDAVVLATGNVLPAIPSFLAGLAGADDQRFIRDPWSEGSLDRVQAGETVVIVGMGHTAMDLAASVIHGRRAAHVVAVSRHGELPRTHEDPWRPRPSSPAFTPADLAAADDPIAEAIRRLREYPGGWRQGIDSIRPINRQLWLSLDDATRRRFVTEHRRDWETHRSRFSAGVGREIAAWEADGTLERHAGAVRAVSAMPDGLRVETDDASWTAGHVLLATGPSESPSASPLLSSLVAAGIARPGSQDLGVDVDVETYRLLDADGVAAREIHALGPIIRGAVWETIAVPEIRAEAAAIAAEILGEG